MAKGSGFLSKHALVAGRVLLIIALGASGFFSRALGGFQENQAVANLLGKVGFPFQLAGVIDFAALIAGGIEVMVGTAVFAIPYALNTEGFLKEGAKWVLQPTGAFLFGRGANLLIASIRIQDNSGTTLKQAVERSKLAQAASA